MEQFLVVEYNAVDPGLKYTRTFVEQITSALRGLGLLGGVLA